MTTVIRGALGEALTPRKQFVLLRPRTTQVGPLADVPLHPGAGRDDGAVVRVGLLAVLLADGQRLHRRPEQRRFPKRPGASLHRGRQHPGPPLRRVRGHAVGADGNAGRRRRGREGKGAAGHRLHVRLGDARLRPHRLLDVEPRRLVVPDGRARLRRRNARAHRLGRGGVGVLDDARSKAGPWHARAEFQAT